MSVVRLLAAVTLATAGLPVWALLYGALVVSGRGALLDRLADPAPLESDRWPR